MHNDSKVTVYGADWCAMTTRTRQYLDGEGIAYRYINVEEDPQASDWVKSVNQGKEKKPTVDVDGEVLSEPRDEELEEVLMSKGLLQ